VQMEPRLQKRWESMAMDSQIWDKTGDNGEFVFHDGPPYANGPIHLGHLLNKVLKDMVVRSRTMDGYDVKFVPGWDCHGLPIEHKVMKDLGAKAKELTKLKIREICEKSANKFIDKQMSQLKRLGTTGRYDDPYRTMVPQYEADVLLVFSDLLKKGIVYRDLKPVHWSIANQTALAEAELEYFEKEDTSVYVLFPIEPGAAIPKILNAPNGEVVHLMIWTTTPWTLPANMAVAVSPQGKYGLYEYFESEHKRYVILVEELAEKVFKDAGIDSFQEKGSCTGQELADAGFKYQHPFISRECPVVTADYVTFEDGTGLVHTAPGHGNEDYLTGLKEKLDIYCPVKADGTYDDTVPDFLIGKDVWAGNKLVVEELQKHGFLFRAHLFKHSYPHDWRSKTPTIFRATEQWFIGVDQKFGEEAQSLRERALYYTAEKIRFVPDWGKNRLQGMIESRPDWCLSRQRVWGLPIPAFTTADGECLITPKLVEAVSDQIREKGSDIWFKSTPQEILAAYDPITDEMLPESAKGNWVNLVQELKLSSDIFDVWFESGSSWNSVLRARGIGYPADLYLEGSDQHRGWFQLSLLPGLGVTGVSPFKTLLTHGFMVDGKGHKMSKSIGNTVDVEDLLKQYGADICRWWVSSLNYVNDIKVDWAYFKTASEEYRKVRNTIRFLLSNLVGFDPDKMPYKYAPEDSKSIDGWIREEFRQVVNTCKDSYANYQFKRVNETIFNFCNDELSSIYLAAVKDRLYCEALDSKKRRRTQQTIFEIADGLIKLIAPILVHTAEEAFLSLRGENESSKSTVHLSEFSKTGDSKLCDDRWAEVMEIRDRVLKKLEEAKEAQGISHAMDAGIEIKTSSDQCKDLLDFADDLNDLCNVSRFKFSDGGDSESPIVVVQDLRDEPRCERSWKRDGTVRERSDGGMLTDRDAAVVGV